MDYACFLFLQFVEQPPWPEAILDLILGNEPSMINKAEQWEWLVFTTVSLGSL